MKTLAATVEQSIRRRRLLRRGESVLVAVSGGLDSMALLRVLQELAAKYEWRLVVAHFNHRLRGAESDGDERFVKDIALRCKLGFVAARADVRGFARREKSSVEMAARQLRHAFLARAAKRLKIPTVALAHHADDQVELFLLRLLRGAGSEGLGGMKWSSASASDPAVRLVRPLLDQPKSELRRFAEEKGIAFREDATNAQLNILRNRIRHKLLPLLSQKYQPATAASILRAMEIIGAEADFVRRNAEEWLGQVQREDFEKLHPALQRQVVRIQLMKTDVVPDFSMVERLRGTAEEVVPLGSGLGAYRDRAGRIVKQVMTRPIFDPDQIAVELKARRGAFEFGGLRIRWGIEACGLSTGRKPKFTRDKEYFDADRVGDIVILRHWRRGDRFQPIGMKVDVKLQDFFVNQKVSRTQRHQLVVATTAAGELFWVEGMRIAERFKLDNQTVHRLKWRWFGR